MFQDWDMDEEEEGVNTSCGLTKSCQPKWLQKLSCSKAFLVVITLTTIVQGFAINGINNSNTVMYERRYQLTSRVTSLISVFQDVTSGLVVIAVGYYGASRHQPRIIAISLLVLCIGLFTMCLAQIVAPPYAPAAHSDNSSQLNMCSLNDDVSAAYEADAESSNVKNYVYFLIAGQLLNGYTSACLYTLGMTFIELTTSSANSALYLGIFSGGSVLGPAIGFLSGGTLLDIYVDYPASPPNDLTPSDPAWVGAWWLGFVIAIALTLILAFILFHFPQEFPDTAAIKEAKISEAHDNGTAEEIRKPGFGMSWRHLPRATWYLLKNPCFMCLSVVDAVELGLILSYATFTPKILSVQFEISPSFASLLMGIIVIPSTALGEIAGGIIIRKWNFNVKQMLTFTLVCSVIAMCLTPVYLARCPDVVMAGVSVGYPGTGDLKATNLTSACNEDCGCTATLYDPVCSDGVQYFSPCHAGCTEEPEVMDDGSRVYSDCKCPLESGSINITVVSGKCTRSCPLLYSVYIPVGFLVFVFTFLMGTPMVVSTLRVVPAELRTYGLALHTTFLRFLGSVPAPIIFGVMIDASCAIWQETDGETGSCWVYDNQELSIRLMVLVLIYKAISITFTILASVLYKPPKHPVQEDLNLKPNDISMKEEASSLGSLASDE